jgi:hypothetical protein
MAGDARPITTVSYITFPPPSLALLPSQPLSSSPSTISSNAVQPLSHLCSPGSSCYPSVPLPRRVFRVLSRSVSAPLHHVIRRCHPNQPLALRCVTYVSFTFISLYLVSPQPTRTSLPSTPTHPMPRRALPRRALQTTIARITRPPLRGPPSSTTPPLAPPRARTRRPAPRVT